MGEQEQRGEDGNSSPTLKTSPDRYLFNSLFGGETFLVAMVLDVSSDINNDLACAVQGLLRATTQFQANWTSILKAVRTVLLNHLVLTLHAKNLWTALAIDIFLSYVSTSMTRSVVALFCLRLRFLQQLAQES